MELSWLARPDSVIPGEKLILRATEGVKHIEQDQRSAGPARCGVEMAGLEPAASSVRARVGSPLCEAAFTQVAADRRGRVGRSDAGP